MKTRATELREELREIEAEIRGVKGALLQLDHEERNTLESVKTLKAQHKLLDAALINYATAKSAFDSLDPKAPEYSAQAVEFKALEAKLADRAATEKVINDHEAFLSTVPAKQRALTDRQGSAMAALPQFQQALKDHLELMNADAQNELLSAQIEKMRQEGLAAEKTALAAEKAAALAEADTKLRQIQFEKEEALVRAAKVEEAVTANKHLARGEPPVVVEVALLEKVRKERLAAKDEAVEKAKLKAAAAKEAYDAYREKNGVVLTPLKTVCGLWPVKPADGKAKEAAPAPAPAAGLGGPGGGGK